MSVLLPALAVTLVGCRLLGVVLPGQAIVVTCSSAVPTHDAGLPDVATRQLDVAIGT